MTTYTREELVADLRAFYDKQDEGDALQAAEMGNAFDRKLANSDFTIDELSEDAYFIKDDKKKS
ncbi:MAG: hypothetical protein WB677_15420 [Xanthobacteraceae bacterium]